MLNGGDLVHVDTAVTSAGERIVVNVFLKNTPSNKTFSFVIFRNF